MRALLLFTIDTSSQLNFDVRHGQSLLLVTEQTSFCEYSSFTGDLSFRQSSARRVEVSLHSHEAENNRAWCGVTNIINGTYGFGLIILLSDPTY